MGEKKTANSGLNEIYQYFTPFTAVAIVYLKRA